MIENIKRLGLNEYESRAYKALLKLGRASAVGVSRGAGVPRARVYDVLFSLEKKGFAIRSAGKPVEFHAVKPTKAFEAIAGRQRAGLESRLGELASVAGLIEKSASFEDNLGEEAAWIISGGRQNIYSFISQQLEKCSDCVFINSSESGLKRKKAAFGPGLVSLSRKGVRVVMKPVGQGSGNSLRSVVFDKDSVLLFLGDEKQDASEEKALFIKSQPIASYFSSGAKK